jgi:ribosomal peptide maturation radical SAM protein 1
VHRGRWTAIGGGQGGPLVFDDAATTSKAIPMIGKKRRSMANDTFPLRHAGDILLILPPFAAANRPSLGLSLLQQIASDESLFCEVYYATLHLARAFGEETYLAIAERHNLDLLGERLFSPYAFPGVEFDNQIYTEHEEEQRRWYRHILSAPAETRFKELETTVGVWLEEFRQLLRQLDYRVFGLSTMFLQNLCCVCLARIIKEEKPNSLVLIGGANCDGEMARGIAALSSDFDYIFIGEAEATFRTFCRELRENKLPQQRFIPGPPTADLDQLDCPDYQGYFAQLSFFLPETRMLAQNQIVIPYETSRGCWWGQKHHCTFCGLNANGMASRIKDSAKALADLRELRQRHGRTLIAMADNMMPMQYFNTLLPTIATEGLDLDIFYEEKSNLKYHQLKTLKAAGVSAIQPGVEALCTTLLARMRKGVSAAQNIRLLRDCRSLGISTSWNLLFDFPGDTDIEYEEELSLIRKLRHLSPPAGCLPVYFDRFSPYFREPEKFGIRNLRPLKEYSAVYPPHLVADDFAYHFIGDADILSNRNATLLGELSAEVDAWIADWQARKPILSVSRFPTGEYVVYDTRRVGNPFVQVISPAVAALITDEARSVSAEVEQAMAHDWVVAVDGVFVGVGVAGPDVIAVLRGIETMAPSEATCRTVREREPHFS